MNQINSYPTVFALGHSAVRDLFSSDVIIEEKVDGSQFSFGVVDGELVCRSKGQQLIADAPEKMFSRGVEAVKGIFHLLTPGWIYRGEYLEKPKHNTLAYSRIPANHIIIFDIRVGEETYLSASEKQTEAMRLGLETVPLLFSGKVENFDEIAAYLDRDSVLGGAKIEGVVVKNYNVFTPEKKISVAKFVSESFKEKNGANWKAENPTAKDMEILLSEQYRTKARFQKAVQHLREAGELEGSPRDIALLVREVPADIQRECEEEIKQALFDHFWPKIQRGVIRGLPEWYKEQLAQTAFENAE